MRKLLSALIAIALVLACKKESTQTTATAAVPNVATGSATTSSAPPSSPPAAAQQNQPSLTSFSAGALIAQKPQEYDEGWSAFWLLDEKPQTGWATPENVVTPQTI